MDLRTECGARSSHSHVVVCRNRLHEQSAGTARVDFTWRDANPEKGQELITYTGQ